MSASSGYGTGGSTPVGPVVETLTGNVGGPVPPTGNNINIIGAGGVLVTGNPGTSTLTITVAGDASLFTEDVGTAAPAGGNLNIFGGASTAGVNMNTFGSGNTVDIILNDSLFFPNTNNTGTQGVLFWGGLRFLHNYNGGGVDNNVFLGEEAGNLTLLSNATANVGVGAGALESLVGTLVNNGASNVAVGNGCLEDLTNGSFNTAVGGSTAFLLTTGQGNIFVGFRSGENLLTGNTNILIGADDNLGPTSPGVNYTSNESSNIILGNAPGVALETNVMRLGDDGVGAGLQNACYIGGVYQRSFASPSGVMQIDSTFKVGSSRGTNGQLLIGSTGASPLWANLTSVGGSVVITNGANTINLEATGTGAGASAFPTDSGTANEAAGVLNIFSGATSAFNNMNTTGSGNTVRVRLNDAINLPATTSASAGVYGIGGDRFVHSFGAPSNTFVGLDAGNLTTITGLGSANTGIGQESLLSLVNGTENAALGFRTLQDLTDGEFNTACGYEALRTLITGTNNIAIGAAAGNTYTSSESSNIIIGNLGVVSESNVIRIGTDGSGTGEQDACYVAGIYNRSIGDTNAPVFIDSTGKLGTKESTTPLGNASFFAQVTLNGGGQQLENMPQVSGTQSYFLGTSQAENLMWDDFGTFTNGPLPGGCFFTVPTDGIYQIHFSMGIFATNTSIFGGLIFVNGVNRRLVTQAPTPGAGTPGFINTGSSTSVNALLTLNTGDVVSWQVVYNCSSLNPIALNLSTTFVYGVLLRALP